MTTGRMALGTALLVALCGCPDSNNGNGSCEPGRCATECRTAGYAGGSCTDGTCRCSGATDGGADADADDDGAVRDDAAADEGGGGHYCAEASYIWIANTAEGTLSKLCTLDGIEVGRYATSSLGAGGDPSRTSVNLHGEMVVTNRDTEGGPSSVTKFAAEPEFCVDRDGDTRIRTSRGGDDVLPWGEDECMLWNTPLNAGTTGIGARATAWDGREDPTTGRGGTVWIGAGTSKEVFQLDGDTGAILWHGTSSIGGYGGVMDGRGNFWMVAMTCTVSGMMANCPLVRINTETKEQTPFTVPCGYGITADSQVRIWTSGSVGFGSCVNRLDPATGEHVTYRQAGTMTDPVFFRGIAVDNRGSVWVASTSGDVLQINEADVTLVHTVEDIAPEAVVGVAIDFQYNVWAVSQGGNAAVKIDPATYSFERFPVGRGPYTYSDMTGYQLRTVII